MTASMLNSKTLVDCLLGLGRGQSPIYVEGESTIYAINQKCVRNGSVDITHARAHDSSSFVKEFAFLRHGDVCINSTGTGTIGRVGLWSESATGNFFVDSHVTIARPNPALVNPSYLAAVLQSPFVQSAMETYCFSGSTNQIELNKTTLSELKLDLLPRTEQDAVAKVLISIDQAIEQTEAIIAKQKRIKTGLMQDLLTKGIDENGIIRSETTHEFKDSPLGRIPVEWDVRPLWNIAVKIADRDHTTPMYVEEGVLIISPMAFYDDEGINFKKCPHITPRAHAINSRKTNCQPKDIILHRIGAGLGKVRVIQEDHPEFSILHSLALIRLDFNQANTNFIKWSFRSFDLQNQMGLGIQSIGVPDLGLEKVASLVFKVPRSLDEQSQIELVLENTQKLINQLLDSQDKLLSLKSALMQDLLTGKDRVTPLLNSEES